MDRKRQRFGTTLFELLEVGAPRIELASSQQELAPMLVRRDVLRLTRQHRRKCGDRGVAIALFSEDRAEVKVGGDEIGIKCQRPLICARGIAIATLHLQRNAVVVVRFAVEGLAQKCRFEPRRRVRSVVHREAGGTKSSEQCRRRIIGRRNGLCG